MTIVVDRVLHAPTTVAPKFARLPRTIDVTQNQEFMKRDLPAAWGKGLDVPKDRFVFILEGENLERYVTATTENLKRVEDAAGGFGANTNGGGSK